MFAPEGVNLFQTSQASVILPDVSVPAIPLRSVRVPTTLMENY